MTLCLVVVIRCVRRASSVSELPCARGGCSGELGDGGDTGAVGLLLLTVVLGSVAVGYRLHKKRNATTDGSQTSPPLRAAHAHAGTAREELRAQYGRVTEDSDCESKAPQPAANIKSDGNGQPSRQSQYV